MTRYVLIHGVLSYGRRRGRGLIWKEVTGNGSRQKKNSARSLLPLKERPLPLKRRRHGISKGKTFAET